MSLPALLVRSPRGGVCPRAQAVLPATHGFSPRAHGDVLEEQGDLPREHGNVLEKQGELPRELGASRRKVDVLLATHDDCRPPRRVRAMCGLGEPAETLAG